MTIQLQKVQYTYDNRIAKATIHDNITAKRTIHV